MAKTPKDQDEHPEKEAAKRRDKALARMLQTPPKPREAKPQKDRGATNKPGK